MMVGGGLLLLEALDALAVGGVIWSALFGVTGLGFAYAFFLHCDNWWAIITAGALLGLAFFVRGDAGLQHPAPPDAAAGEGERADAGSKRRVAGYVGSDPVSPGKHGAEEGERRVKAATKTRRPSAEVAI